VGREEATNPMNRPAPINRGSFGDKFPHWILSPPAFSLLLPSNFAWVYAKYCPSLQTVCLQIAFTAEHHLTTTGQRITRFREKV